MRFKTFLLFASAIAVAVAMAIVPSHARASTGPGIGGQNTSGQQHTCVWTYDWGVKYGGAPQNIHADWEVNSCRYSLQTLAFCFNPNVGTYTVTSGPVTGLEVNTAASCGNGGDQIQAGYARVNGGTWHLKWQRSLSTIHTTALIKTTGPRPGSGTQKLSARRSSTFDYGDQWFGDFWRDPSDGGQGTVILTSTGSTSNAEDWVLQANGTCGGFVTSTCPGGLTSTDYRGDQIVTLRNVGQGTLCFGADAQTGWLAEMMVCDGVNGIHHYDTLFVWDPGASCGSLFGTDFPSYQWAKNGLPSVGLIVDTSGSNFAAAVQQGNQIAHCPEALWQNLTS
jgi:hypothetical protein